MKTPKHTDSLKSTKSSTKSLITTTKNRSGSKSSVTSQLPKPVECIEVETDDHYCVPPVKVDGEIVTNFQYLTLHEPRMFCDEGFSLFFHLATYHAFVFVNWFLLIDRYFCLNSIKFDIKLLTTYR